jgi:ribulose-phosphate 3-epimerase
MMIQPIILPSLLAAPFDRLGESILELEQAGIDVLHYDVMDGHFVQNLTMGPLIIESLAGKVKSQFDVHLMVENPEKQIGWFDLPSVRSISVHVEASSNLANDLYDIHNRGKKSGVVINPNTPVRWLNPVLAKLDQVLVMSVYPGLGGQKFIEDTLDSVRYLAQQKKEKGYSYIIQIDGGINQHTIKKAADAGVEELVAGSAVFNHPSPVNALHHLQSLIS